MTPRRIPLQLVRRAIRWCNLAGSAFRCGTNRAWVDAHQEYGHAISIDETVNMSHSAANDHSENL